MSLAGSELAACNAKVIDVALKYGYESPDSFAKAFQKFHGILPSAAHTNGSCLNSFSRLVLKISLEGGTIMNYKIEEKPEMILTGYKKRFTGVPYGPDREEQEGQLFITTRAKQWMLRGANIRNSNMVTDICVITNVDDDGYDFYYAAKLGEYERENINNSEITGIDCMEQFGFENIVIPKQTYAIFTTEKQQYPVAEYMDIRQRIVSQWLPSTDWVLAEAPELSMYCWWSGEKKLERYIEIWLPVEKAR